MEKIYTASKNFTLPPVVTAWTNLTSVDEGRAREKLDGVGIVKSDQPPISRPGLVWIEDDLNSGVDGELEDEEEDNDVDIFSFPPMILEGWQPSQGRGDKEGKNYESRDATSLPEAAVDASKDEEAKMGEGFPFF